MAKAKITAKGNVQLTLKPNEARMLRDVLSCVGGNSPHHLLIDALESVGYRYLDHKMWGISGKIYLEGEY